MPLLKFITSAKLLSRLSAKIFSRLSGNTYGQLFLFNLSNAISSNQRQKMLAESRLTFQFISFNHTRNMDTIFEKFSTLWSKSLLDANDKSANAANSQFFHKARLDSGLYQDMLDYLKEEFYNCKENIFATHLYLIERALKEKVKSLFS